MGGVAAAGGISAAGQYLGREKGWRPDKQDMNYYAKRERGEIERLYDETPYAKDPSLGFSRNVMEGKTAEGRDLSRGERTGAKQRIGDAYRRVGGMGVKSAQYDRANERADLNALTTMALVNRQNIIADAQMRRQDYSRRLGAISMALRGSAGIYNPESARRSDQNMRAYGAVGGAIDSGVSTALQRVQARRETA